MYTSLQAVALRTVRHNDRSSILTAWSPVMGRLSLVMPAGNGPESRRRRALTMPLCLFEGEVDVRPGRELHTVRDIRRCDFSKGASDLASHPVRATVAMFLAEVLSVVTREGDADRRLWSLIVETNGRIATGNGVALSNLPVMFLMRLASCLGIDPDFGEMKSGMGFDMAEGIFRVTRPMHDHWVAPEETRVTAAVWKLAEGYRHISLVRLPRSVRRKILNGIIRYYVLHHYPLDRLRSLDILKTVFDS